MTYNEKGARLICGDAREELKTLPAESVDLIKGLLIALKGTHV